MITVCRDSEAAQTRGIFLAGPVLKEIHRLRRYVQDLESRTTQAPRQLQLQKSKLQQAEDALKALREARDDEGRRRAADALKQALRPLRKKGSAGGHPRAK